MDAETAAQVAAEVDVVALAVVHPLKMWVNALEALIAPLADLTLVSAHTDPGWVRNAVGRGTVDVVVLGLDDQGGAAAVRQMREQCADLGVLVISDSDDPEFIAEIVRAGARGYLGHNCSLGELVEAVHSIHRGETWMRPHHLTRLIDGLLTADSQEEQEHDRLAPLSTREREILQCLALGMRRQEIAERLFLSPNTVRTHIHHVLRKLEVHSTIAAVAVLRRLPEPRGQGSDGQLASGS